jgi:hypothetical protein
LTAFPTDDVWAIGNASSSSYSGCHGRTLTARWAVGYDDDHSGSIPVRKTVWMHFDGARWSVVPSPNTGSGDNTLLGVIAPAGTSDVWAWGNSAGGTLVQRFTR